MGRARNLIGNKYFRYGVNTATCTVEGYQKEYKPKSGSGVHATHLVSHLIRKHPSLYSEAVKGKQSPRRQLQLLILNHKEQAVRLSENL